MKKIVKYLIFPILILNLYFSFSYNVSAALETNPDATYDTTTISCGNVQGIPKGIPLMTRNIIKVIKVLVPVILIIIGIIDMFKAMSANDEKIMKESTNRFIKRCIAAILVFFSIVLIQFVINTLVKASKNDESEIKKTSKSILSCIDCFITSKKSCKSDDFFDDEYTYEQLQSMCLEKDLAGCMNSTKEELKKKLKLN